MKTPYIIRGHLSDSRHVELDEPVSELNSEVEVLVRPPIINASGARHDIFDLIRALKPGKRTKEEIDQQVRGVIS
jgi:hypothetical protein